jgi:hypothetical protein
MAGYLNVGSGPRSKYTAMSRTMYGVPHLIMDERYSNLEIESENQNRSFFIA